LTTEGTMRAWKEWAEAMTAAGEVLICCVRCGRPAVRTTGRMKVCPSCRPEVTRERQRAIMAARRSGSKVQRDERGFALRPTVLRTVEDVREHFTDVASCHNGE